MDEFVFDEPVIANLGIDGQVFSTLTAVLGFLLSFRTGQAYMRFWDGTHAAYEVTGGLYMAASNLMAFAYHGNAPQEEIRVFKQTIVRFMSLLSAMMLTQLEGKDTLNGDSPYVTMDVGSLDMHRVRILAREERKAEVVVQWIKILIIESINKGTLTVPPPILTRVFQELDVSMGTYHSAARFSEVPFPFPYAATIDLILWIHALVTPLVVINLFPAQSYLPIFAVFLIEFFLWSMHLVASELENPFDGDTNDLELEFLQGELNEKLKSICSISPEDVPRLVVGSEVAAVYLSKCEKSQNRRRSVALSSEKVIRCTYKSTEEETCSILEGATKGPHDADHSGGSSVPHLMHSVDQSCGSNDLVGDEVIASLCEYTCPHLHSSAPTPALLRDKLETS